jgi:hypothetical protein
MSETQKLLERQAGWQKGRAALTWSEKIRMAEAVRESVAQLRRARLLRLRSAPLKPSTTVLRKLENRK